MANFGLKNKTIGLAATALSHTCRYFIWKSHYVNYPKKYIMKHPFFTSIKHRQRKRGTVVACSRSPTISIKKIEISHREPHDSEKSQQIHLRKTVKLAFLNTRCTLRCSKMHEIATLVTKRL